MENSIRDYISEGTVVSYRQIVERFGEPKQVAAAYVAEMDTKELLCAIQLRNGTQRMVKFVVMAAVMIWFGFHLLAYVDHVKDTNGYAVIKVVEYERIEIDEGGE